MWILGLKGLIEVSDQERSSEGKEERFDWHWTDVLKLINNSLRKYKGN